jgi:ABC-type antimicrobial peptide transport system permease subunit
MKDAKPADWTLRLLAILCPDYLLEEIEGDLLQRFQKDVRLLGERKAQRKFVWNVIRYCRPGILIRHKFSLDLIPIYMLANYFKVASRVMVRNKSFSFINILGLTMGLTGALLLFLWIGKEFTYDEFHTNKADIYKAWNRTRIDGTLQCWDKTPRILAPTVTQDYSAVESAVSFADYNAAFLFTKGDTRLMKNSGAFTDPQFLTMFSFPLVKGDPSKALSNPNSIVLTEEFARELFGDKEAFGEVITVWEENNSFDFTITGILKELPANTSFAFQYLIPFHFLESIGEKDTHWGNNSVSTYIQLKEGTDANSFNEEIKDITRKHTSGENTTEVFLYPLTKLRLYSRFDNGIPAGGRIEVVRLLGILGICLVAIACINFINLSTARAQKRSKEVGIRKVTGAYRYSLVVQFLCESILITAMAGILAVVLVMLFLPAFGNLVEQKLTLQYTNVAIWSAIGIGILTVGVLAGCYPAFYLSSFNPVRVLKGAPLAGTSRNFFRKVLVIFQFSFAMTLIIATLVVQDQIEYAQNRDAGYAQENMVYQYITGDLEKNYQAYKNELLQAGIAVSVTKTSSPITEVWSNSWEFGWNGKDPQSKIVVDRFYTDEDIVTTAGLTLVAGRDMDLDKYPTDSTAVLLNEAAVKVMGFKNPIGELITDSGTEWHVVGVVKDFLLRSPFQKVKPMVLQGSKGWFSVIHMRLNSNRPLRENVAALEKLHAKYNPVYPFGYEFVDDEYKSKFVDQEKTQTITTIFTSLAIFISCLGLLGLSTYIIESRVKEIGIRKILGASITNIAQLLSKDSMRMIIIGILVGCPSAWWGLNQWLMSFEYRTTMKLWTFLVAAAAIIIVAGLTIVIQIMRAARANPVTSLKQD